MSFLKKNRKQLAFLLCVLLMLSLIPVGAFADEGDGENAAAVEETVSDSDASADGGEAVSEESDDPVSDENEPNDPAEEENEESDSDSDDADPAADDAGGEDFTAGPDDPGVTADEDLTEETPTDEEPGEISEPEEDGQENAGFSLQEEASTVETTEEKLEAAQEEASVAETAEEELEAAQEEALESVLEAEEFSVEEELSWDCDDSDWDNEALLDGYAQTRLNNAKGGMLRASFYAGRRLNSMSATQGAIYFFLKSKVTDIAAGNLTSSSFSGNISDLGLAKTRYTAQELGLTTIDDSNDEAAFELLKTEAGLETNAALGMGDGITPAVHALISDCPYELYWFNKAVKGAWAWGYSYTYGYTYEAGVKVYYIEATKYTYQLKVAAAYAGSGDYTVSTASADLINTAISTAQGIAAEAAGLNDREKLVYFKNQICSLTSYNSAAADDDSTPYGNPWQLIWVFDGDETTTVVCEGYSKAFQYLCELSRFDSNVDVYSVTGSISGGHMWNIVSMDGYNFLVDVTNCDTGTIGSPDKLFMTGYDSGSVTNGYTFDCGYKTITYTYDSSTRATFGDSALTLVPKHVTVTVSSESDGDGAVGLLTGGGRYVFGDAVTVTASDVNGYAFMGWYRDGSLVSTSRTYSFAVTENVALTALYQGYGTATLTVNNAANVSINGERRGSESFGVTFPVGTVITLAYAGEGEFLRWCNESNMTESRNATFSFTLVRNKTVTAMADENSETGNSAFVEFVSDYGQVLQAGIWNSTDTAESHVLPPGPSMTGKQFSGWSLDGENAVTAAGILSQITASVRRLTVSPLYTEENTLCTITVNYDGIPQTLRVRKGISLVLHARTVEGKSFDHWEDGNGTLLGTGESYSLLVTGDRTFSAVYTNEAAREDVPVLAVAGIDPVNDAGMHKIAFRVTRQIPEGYTLQRLLILVSDDPDFGSSGAESRMLADCGIPQAVSTRTELTGTLTVNKRVSDDSTVWYARGYMLLMDSAGHETEVYTPIVSASYAELVS